MSEPSADAPVCYRHPGRETWIRCQRCDNPICPDCMVPASVGFQCPTCVKQGTKSTRSARLPYGGERSTRPALTSQVLVAVNVAVWLLITAVPRVADWLSLLPHGRCQLGDGNSFYPGVGEAACVGGDVHWVPGVADGAVWQLLTSAFTHIQATHVLVNVLVIWFLGPQLELILGRARFLALYLVSALTGSAAVMLLSGEYSQTLGASGAVFGMVGAYFAIAVRARGDVQGIGLWLGLLIVSSFVRSDVSWQGHLGGLAGGLLVAGALLSAPKGDRRPLVQWSAVAVLAVAAVAVALARAAALA